MTQASGHNTDFRSGVAARRVLVALTVMAWVFGGAAVHGGESCCAGAGGASRAAWIQQAVQDDGPAADVAAKTITAAPDSPTQRRKWIPGGTFVMGSTDPLARPDESPVHRVRVAGFWMDETEVTNARFRAFVEATGYVTVAERPIDWNELKKQVPEGTPPPPPEMLQPGSLCFTPPDHPVDTRNYAQWWTWTHGADWRHPDGPGSTIDGKDDHPVVQVAYEDALAYARWAGGDLPTEAEWECAARGGLDHAVNTWGDDPIDATRANTWQGHFPDLDTADDGFARTAPVKSFAPNGFGLYDMAGNVWEWCRDLYRPDTYARRRLVVGADGIADDPTGPTRSYDPRSPHEPVVRVQRGGSFLCNDSYCASYRVSARMACAPDTGMAHVGFRCVWREPPPAAAAPPTDH